MDLLSSNLMCSKVNCIPIDLTHSLGYFSCVFLSFFLFSFFFFFFATWLAES